MTQNSKRLTGYRWVIISFIGFIVSLVALFLILSLVTSDALGKFSGILFYIVLIPFGLVAAGFLFGALKSYAKASGKNIHGTLELGGPVVIFVLLVYGGIYFQNNFEEADTFSLHVYFYGDANKAKKLTGGEVRFITNGSPITKTIDNEGQVSISYPTNIRGKQINIDPNIEGYQKNQIAATIPENGDILEVILTEQSYATNIYGYVYDGQGQVPKGPLTLEWAGINVPIDANGKYNLTLPYPPGTVKNLKIFMGNKIVYNIDQAIQDGSFDIKITLP